MSVYTAYRRAQGNYRRIALIPLLCQLENFDDQLKNFKDEYLVAHKGLQGNIWEQNSNLLNEILSLDSMDQYSAQKTRLFDSQFQMCYGL